MATAAPGRGDADLTALRMVVDVDLGEAAGRLTALGERFARLVESIGAPDVPAGKLEWTVAETAVHVLKGFEYYAACIRGETYVFTPRGEDETFPAYTARENRLQIEAEPERDPIRLAARLRTSLRDLVETALDAGPDGVAVFAAGYSEDTTTSVCTILSELVVHGHDIAGASGAKWEVDPSSAVLAVYATTGGLPLALDGRAAAGKDIHVVVRLRHGSPFRIRIREGRVWCETMEGTAGKPDAHVWADPVAYLLVGFGRTSIARQIVRGRLVAWGRRPWVLLQMPSLLVSP